MDYSELIARLLGMYIVIMGLGVLLREDSFTKTMHAIFDNRAVLVTLSLLGFIIGLVLVVTHNYWAWDWRVVVTILSWWICIKGGLLFWFPEIADEFRWMIEKRNYYRTSSIASLLLGIYLLYCGFIGF